MSCFPCRAAAALLLLFGPLASQPVPLSFHVLPNGMRILLLERHEEPTIACGWVVRVGSANERPGITGIAHLFEHMMFKGTRVIGTRDAARDAELNTRQDQVMAAIRQELDLRREQLRRGEIASLDDTATRSPRHRELLCQMDALVLEQRNLIVKDELDKVYGQYGATGLNANTNQDRTFFHVDVPSNRLELWAWLESDRLRNAVFREFYSERDVVLEERRQRIEATPAGKFQEALLTRVWQAHPYRWPVIGWPSDIACVTRDEADTFYATYYKPSNITAILVGDFRSEEALALLKRYFGRIPSDGRPIPAVTVQEPPQPGERRIAGSADASPQVMAAYRTVAAVHRDAPALTVLRYVLNGESGRLTRELVYRQRMAVEARAEDLPQRFLGLFLITGVPVPGHTPEEVEGLLEREVERLKRDGITDRELQKARNQIQMDAFERNGSNGQLRDQLAEAESCGSYQDFLDEPARLQAVTREDVQRVARDYLVPTNCTTLILRRKETQE